jgi:hypothetical protein
MRALPGHPPRPGAGTDSAARTGRYFGPNSPTRTHEPEQAETRREFSAQVDNRPEAHDLTIPPLAPYAHMPVTRALVHWRLVPHATEIIPCGPSPTSAPPCRPTRSTRPSTRTAPPRTIRRRQSDGEVASGGLSVCVGGLATPRSSRKPPHSFQLLRDGETCGVAYSLRGETADGRSEHSGGRRSERASSNRQRRPAPTWS